MSNAAWAASEHIKRQTASTEEQMQRRVMEMLEQEKHKIYREAAIAKQREDDKIHEMFQLARTEAIGKIKQAMADDRSEEVGGEISPILISTPEENEVPRATLSTGGLQASVEPVDGPGLAQENNEGGLAASAEPVNGGQTALQFDGMEEEDDGKDADALPPIDAEMSKREDQIAAVRAHVDATLPHANTPGIMPPPLPPGQTVNQYRGQTRQALDRTPSKRQQKASRQLTQLPAEVMNQLQADKNKKSGGSSKSSSRSNSAKQTPRKLRNKVRQSSHEHVRSAHRNNSMLNVLYRGRHDQVRRDVIVYSDGNTKSKVHWTANAHFSKKNAYRHKKPNTKKSNTENKKIKIQIEPHRRRGGAVVFVAPARCGAPQQAPILASKPAGHFQNMASAKILDRECARKAQFFSETKRANMRIKRYKQALEPGGVGGDWQCGRGATTVHRGVRPPWPDG